MFTTKTLHVNTKSGILGFDLDLLTNFFCVHLLTEVEIIAIQKRPSLMNLSMPLGFTMSNPDLIETNMLL